MKGDVGMSHHEKEGEQEDAYTKTESHNPIPTSLYLVQCDCPSAHTQGIRFKRMPCVYPQVSKWVGDIFNHGLYDIHVELKNTPLLGWESPHRMEKLAIHIHTSSFFSF